MNIPVNDNDTADLSCWFQQAINFIGKVLSPIIKFGFPTRSDTSRTVQSKGQARVLNFGFEEKRDCTIYVVKTRALISYAVTA